MNKAFHFTTKKHFIFISFQLMIIIEAKKKLKKSFARWPNDNNNNDDDYDDNVKARKKTKQTNDCHQH